MAGDEKKKKHASGYRKRRRRRFRRPKTITDEYTFFSRFGPARRGKTIRGRTRVCACERRTFEINRFGDKSFSAARQRGGRSPSPFPPLYFRIIYSSGFVPRRNGYLRTQITCRVRRKNAPLGNY